MAITVKDSIVLMHALTSGVLFQKTLTLGRQHLLFSSKNLPHQLPGQGVPVFKNGDFSEVLFSWLGAKQIDSIDFSDYEGATILHDLNHPVAESLKGVFTCIFDGGTLEHIYNFPQAIQNCMTMLTVGGHFIGISPVNNQLGHGFYQFSPELYYRIFSYKNGFKVEKMLVSAPEQEDIWYEVVDPESVQERVIVTNSSPLTLVVIAKKVHELPFLFPQQSDYVKTWEGSKRINKGQGDSGDPGWKKIYHGIFPISWRPYIKAFYKLLVTPKKYEDSLGLIDPRFFKKVDLLDRFK